MRHEILLLFGIIIFSSGSTPRMYVNFHGCFIEACDSSSDASLSQDRLLLFYWLLSHTVHRLIMISESAFHLRIKAGLFILKYEFLRLSLFTRCRWALWKNRKFVGYMMKTITFWMAHVVQEIEFNLASLRYARLRLPYARKMMKAGSHALPLRMINIIMISGGSYGFDSSLSLNRTYSMRRVTLECSLQYQKQKEIAYGWYCSLSRTTRQKLDFICFSLSISLSQVIQTVLESTS